MLVGNNEDWYDRDTFVWFLPGGDGEYGYVSFGQEDGQPQGGMNEAGLFFDIVAYAEPRLAPNPEGKPDYPGNKGNMLLESCADVDEAIEFISQFSPAEYGYITMMLVDRSGASATVTWDWAQGKMVFDKKEAGPNVIGYGEQTVRPMLENNAVTVENFRDMLDAAHQGDLTLYSNICNPVTGDIYIYNQHNYDKCVQYNLKEELEKGKHIYYIPALFPEQEPGVYNQYTPLQFVSSAGAIAYALLAGILAFSIIFWLCQIKAKRKALKAVVIYYSASILGSASGIALILLAFFRICFLVRYGISLFGPLAAMLPWALVVFCLLEAVFAVLLWIRKDTGRFSKIIYTITVIVQMLLLYGAYALGIWK